MCPVVLDLEKIVAYDNVFSHFFQSSQDNPSLYFCQRNTVIKRCFQELADESCFFSKGAEKRVGGAYEMRHIGCLLKCRLAHGCERIKTSFFLNLSRK